MPSYSTVIACLSLFNTLFCTFEMGRISAGAHISLATTVIIMAISIIGMIDALKDSSK